MYICTYICEYNYISIFLSYLNSVAFDIFLVENYFFIKSFSFSVCDTLAALNVFINLFLKIPHHSPVFFVNWFSYSHLYPMHVRISCDAILPFPRIFSFFHFMLEQESMTQESMTHPNLSFSTLQPNFLDWTQHSYTPLLLECPTNDFLYWRIHLCIFILCISEWHCHSINFYSPKPKDFL